MKRHGIALATLALAAFVATFGYVRAQDDKVNLKVGDPAPKFDSVDEDGKAWKSSDHVGKKIVVVYFYPADLTGGCTKQACAFRDDMKQLAGKGVEVIGVSGDAPKN